MDTLVCFLVLAAAAFHTSVCGVYIQSLDPDFKDKAEEPPMLFPSSDVRLVDNKTASEVPDLLSKVPSNDPDAQSVNHPNVINSNKTHEEGKVEAEISLNKAEGLNNTNVSVSNSSLNIERNGTITNETSLEVSDVTTAVPNVVEESTVKNDSLSQSGTIHTCPLPKALLPGADDTAWDDDWMSENSTICEFPRDWVQENNGTIHICSIPREFLTESNYTIHNGTITKELLAKMNTTEISCLTPADIASDNSSSTKLVNGTIPRAWLKDNNDNIYIYFIPRDWIQKNNTDIEMKTTNSTPRPDLSDSSIPAVESTTVANETGNTSTVVAVDPTTTTTTTTTTTAQPTPSSTQEPTVSSTSSTQEPTASSTSSTQKPTVSSTIMIPVKPTKSTTTTTDDSDKNKTIKDKPTSTESDEENLVVSTSPSSPSALSQQHAEHDHGSSSGKTAFLQPTESAAILAGVFVGIALLGYVGLLVWRRVLERRYGNREMLVNEDDDFDTSDMRHFEL